MTLTPSRYRADFETLCTTLAPDRRLRLLDVALESLEDASSEGDRLVGTADAGLELPLTRFAQQHGLRCEIDFISPPRHFLVRDHSVLRCLPDAESEVVTDVRYGEALYRYDEWGGFVRVATERDHYLGWLVADALSPGVAPPTHRVVAPRGHVFAAPSVKAEPRFRLAHGVMLQVTNDQDNGWSEVVYGPGHRGFVRTRLLASKDDPLPVPDAADIAAFAQTFLHTPYLWGCGDAWGLDCSGFVQHVYAAFGIALPRDADQQAEATRKITRAELRRGDLLFFPGHVAIALDERRFIHANAHHMRVTIDALDAPGYGEGLAEQITKLGRIDSVCERCNHNA